MDARFKVCSRRHPATRVLPMGIASHPLLESLWLHILPRIGLLGSGASSGLARSRAHARRLCSRVGDWNSVGCPQLLLLRYKQKHVRQRAYSDNVCVWLKGPMLRFALPGERPRSPIDADFSAGGFGGRGGMARRSLVGSSRACCTSFGPRRDVCVCPMKARCLSLPCPPCLCGFSSFRHAFRHLRAPLAQHAWRRNCRGRIRFSSLAPPMITTPASVLQERFVAHPLFRLGNVGGIWCD